MKLLIVLLCLLLCGCGKEAPETQPTVPAATAAVTPETEPVSMYEPGNPLEAEHLGALRVYPLTMRRVRGIRDMGDDLLVFSGYGSTTITRLTGNELFVTASVTLDFELDPHDPSLRITEDTLSYYDSGKKETVILNDSLREVTRIVMTDNVTGSPILSADRNTLYYCTSDAILAWDQETGIHRTVKELSYDDQLLTGLHLNETVLQCRILDRDTVRTLFLESATGRLLSQQEGELSLVTEKLRYYAALPVSAMQMLVFGETSGDPQVLFPEVLSAENFYLPKEHAAVTASVLEDESVVLDYYDLDTGVRRAQLSLAPLQNPKDIISAGGDSVYILVYDPQRDCDIIYRWDRPEKTSDRNTYGSTDYTTAYASVNTLDSVGLARCQNRAAEISEKYGIPILIWEDALAVQPWDYEFEAETLPQVLLQELELLDQRLSRFPDGVLEKTASHFTALKICLVRQITGTAASGSLDTATGIQFFDDTDAYVAITVGKNSEQALYHELFHVMETHILNESIAFDQWNELNPEGFAYTYSNVGAQGISMYLEGENRAFVDSYSTTFPKEDRARIMETAMLSGNEAMFEPEIMQNKLIKLCHGIRQAYGLRKSEEVLPWEQYLKTSMAYAK